MTVIIPDCRLLTERPEEFEIDYEHPFAQSLIFAGLGGGFGTGDRYKDYSIEQNHGIFLNMDPKRQLIWSHFLSRHVFQLYHNGSRIFIGDGPNFNLSLTNQFSLCGWVRREIWNEGCSHIITQRDSSGSASSWTHRLIASTPISGFCAVRFTYYNGSWNNVTSDYLAAQVLTWIHAVTVIDGLTCRMYLHGQLVYDNVLSVPVIRNSTKTCLGAIYDGAEDSQCQIADPLIIKRCLTHGEIQELADPSNVMLSGMLRVPKRRIFPVFTQPSYTHKNILSLVSYNRRTLILQR